MTVQQLKSPKTEVTKITISTWVYISKKSVEAQNKAVDTGTTAEGETLDEHFAPKSTRRRIPIMEFGKSVEPFVGIHIGMSMFWEGYLGWFWWAGLVTPPSFPDYIAEYWIGASDSSLSRWFPFDGGVAYPSMDYAQGWENPSFVFFGTSASGAGTAFYWMPVGRNIFPIIPAVHYDFFDDTGIRDFYVENEGLLGPYFALYPAGDFHGDFAKEMSWTYEGQLRVILGSPSGRTAVIEGDIAERSIQVSAEVFFTNFWDSPENNTMQPTPTRGPSPAHTIRVETGGAGKHFAFGDLVVLFPERPNVTYGEPAIPSALFMDGDTVKFLITAKWPEETTSADQEIVPTLTFSAGGFVQESWNHIFFTTDLSTMILAGGQDDKEKLEWIDTLGGPMLNHVPLAPPYLEKPPKFKMLVNGKPTKSDPVAQLTVYPIKDGHWATSGGGGASTSDFKMAMDGDIGFPLIPQEIGRYKTTGPNQDIEYAYTHVWLDKYIEPSKENLSKFFWKSKNKDYNFVIPPPDKKAAIKAFGKPDIWLYRDKEDQVEWRNLGTGGSFTNVGTKPKDFRPGPGQPKRKKKETTT